MNPWWWVAFTDRTRPKGEQALGAVIVQHCGPEVLVEGYLKGLGLHPGGEALFGVIDDRWGLPPPGFLGRVLNAAEAEALAKQWDPGHGGLADAGDIERAFLDDEAEDGDPLFKRGSP